ncbi:Zn-ribbon domain-containing OB-fold protein [Hydrogenophaga sp. BPS33]|uniref:Zn-ribbon domain-containing OB-fold protein n=1 Tax=Hydrogenophaga sp. BPS33 TaxID=2651974 RepID=UPI00132000FF|nr:OB-fold domain-containing protein [Hydrogenophaga sp. BPS33]QHE84269.1 DNA-binding protein [Hydrogenophaga sp. BPS33]
MDDDKTPSCPYTEGLRNRIVRYQRCTVCGTAQTLARYACTGCGSASLAWHEATGRGTVVAVTVVARAPSDAFRALVPYTLVLVDLDEGPRLMAHAEPGVAIGTRVMAHFFVHEGQPLLRFSPATPD